MNKICYIYKITNKINGKIYIGKHTQITQNKDNYFGSGVVLAKAIKKFCKEHKLGYQAVKKYKNKGKILGVKGCSLNRWEIKEIQIDMVLESKKARLQHRKILKQSNLLTKRQLTISKFNI